MKKSLIAATLAVAITFTFGSEEKPKPSDAKLLKYIPKGHRFYNEVRGDLNGDGTEDYLLSIESETAPDSLGIVILFKDGSDYRLALEKLRCFYTEFRGPLFKINRGNIIMSFDGNGTCDRHEWSYTFKYRNSEFELIGYDQYDDMCGRGREDGGGAGSYKESINFLTKKRLTKVNEGKETWDKITTKGPILLRKIDMETININNYMEVAK